MVVASSVLGGKDATGSWRERRLGEADRSGTFHNGVQSGFQLLRLHE
jgi:hypothetical protein